jgi:hypothetical protein
MVVEHTNNGMPCAANDFNAPNPVVGAWNDSAFNYIEELRADGTKTFRPRENK